MVEQLRVGPVVVSEHLVELKLLATVYQSPQAHVRRFRSAFLLRRQPCQRLAAGPEQQGPKASMAGSLCSNLPARAFLLTENPEKPVALPAGSETRGLVISQSSRCPLSLKQPFRKTMRYSRISMASEVEPLLPLPTMSQSMGGPKRRERGTWKVGKWGSFLGQKILNKMCHV